MNRLGVPVTCIGLLVSLVFPEMDVAAVGDRRTTHLLASIPSLTTVGTIHGSDS